ncbi:hypothetical protein FB565_001558 [Actinoplanes lutulentus]|nr:hypothetical protein [Actinoplanes lutulentus]
MILRYAAARLAVCLCWLTGTAGVFLLLDLYT